VRHGAPAIEFLEASLNLIFVYKAGRTRIVEPHDYGIRRDVERLLGFQISGESKSGASHGWNEFDVDQIRHLRVLDRRGTAIRFILPRADTDRRIASTGIDVRQG
jgi:hypothetical protein